VCVLGEAAIHDLDKWKGYNAELYESAIKNVKSELIRARGINEVVTNLLYLLPV